MLKLKGSNTLISKAWGWLVCVCVKTSFLLVAVFSCVHCLNCIGIFDCGIWQQHLFCPAQVLCYTTTSTSERRWSWETHATTRTQNGSIGSLNEGDNDVGNSKLWNVAFLSQTLQAQDLQTLFILQVNDWEVWLSVTVVWKETVCCSRAVMCYKVLVSCEYCACIPRETCVVMYIYRSEGCLKSAWCIWLCRADDSE